MAWRQSVSRGLRLMLPTGFSRPTNANSLSPIHRGHEQYTRNMATGASTADVAILLIDARYGVQVQTRRHAYIVSLLGIKHVIVAINKMDLMDFNQSIYNDIEVDFRAFARELGFTDITCIPISALDGDKCHRNIA